MRVSRFIAAAFAAAAAVPALAAPAKGLHVIHSFAGGSDGASPYGSLIASGGLLYGTTLVGGTANGGTVYSITLAGSETVLHSFTGGSDGKLPFSGVAASNGVLYGTTEAGGTYNQGTVFAVDATTGAETLPHVFLGSDDGAEPQGGVTVAGGVLYGTTYAGGYQNCGSVFLLDPATQGKVPQYNFSCEADGSHPYGNLVYANGVLYGATQNGGAGEGTVFAIDTVTGTETVLHIFNGTDGALPIGNLILVNGVLYGVTQNGGAKGYGTVFAVDATTGAETTLHTFSGGADGEYPSTGLSWNKGLLYGGTCCGGASAYGTIFSVNVATHAEKVLYSFKNGLDGSDPATNLIMIGSTLYGATNAGGKSRMGTVFGLTL